MEVHVAKQKSYFKKIIKKKEEGKNSFCFLFFCFLTNGPDVKANLILQHEYDG